MCTAFLRNSLFMSRHKMNRYINAYEEKLRLAMLESGTDDINAYKTGFVRFETIAIEKQTIQLFENTAVITSETKLDVLLGETR